MPLNTEIRRLRTLKGLSHTATARAIGVGVASIERWERGTFSPKVPQLMALAQLFGVTETDLLHPKEDEEVSNVK